MASLWQLIKVAHVYFLFFEHFLVLGENWTVKHYILEDIADMMSLIVYALL